MKKTVSLILVICLFASLFSGCIFKQMGTGEDIINMQLGGYLYTARVRAETKDERSMLKEREKAVSSMIDYIEKAAVHAFSLTKGLTKYENNLIKYMEKIESGEPADTDAAMAILEKITAYKVVLGSQEDEIRQYMKMKPGTLATEAIINTYKLDSVCKLIETQGVYISWLISNTASIAAILEKDNVRKSGNLLSSSESIYGKQIEGPLTDVYEDFDGAAYLNSVISSADYYASFIYLEQAKDKIGQIESGNTDNRLSAEQISYLNAMYDEAALSVEVPPVLVPIPEEKETFGFNRKVSAFDNDAYAFYTIAYLYSFSVLAQKKGLRNNPHIYDIPSSEDTANELEEQKNEVRKTPEKIPAKIDESPSKAVDDSKETGFLSGLSDKASSLLGGIMEIGNAIVENAIEKIVREAQDYIKGNYGSVDSQYAAIIDKLADHLASAENVNRTNQTDSVKTLITKDLEAMLGGNKEQFVNFILNSNAGELIKTFEEWKEKLPDGDNHVYSQDDLMNLLALMGIEAAVQTPGGNAAASSDPPAQNSPAAVPTAAATEIPAATSEPAGPADPIESVDNYGITHITATWQTIREMDPTMTNENLLSMIYSWGDSLNYADYEKKEILNKDGGLTKIQYLDENGYKVGWETYYTDDYILYTYRFPDDNDRTIEILRYRTENSDYVFEVKTEDAVIDRKTAVRFHYSEQPSDEETIKYIVQKEGGIQDGLNTTLYNSNRTYSIYVMGDLVEQYTFKAKVMIREAHVTYEGDDVTTDIREFYDSGKLKLEYTRVNGKKDGTYILYNEDGGIKSTLEFKDGFAVNP